ncbi:MAG TPA: PilZ domain-containing protein [Devosia sp.]|nr:PilZ domain-containing protein [Devosia sp.]
MDLYQPFLIAKLARRMDVRFIGALSGRYTLSNRRVEGEDSPPVYACRLCSISPWSAVVTAPVRAEIGETVAAHFEHFGIQRGIVSKRMPSGFVMDLQLDEPERAKLADQIRWQKRQAQTREPDKRDYPRIQPHDPSTVLLLADGTRMACFVIDVSQSGAAVSAAILPGRGTPLAVGGLVGRVVRRLDVGFAVQFIKVQETAELERLIAPPREVKISLLDLLKSNQAR